MKLGIHSKIVRAMVTCASCGNKMELSGAFHSEKFTVESCLKCHPAFTGKRLEATTGAVESFNNKFKGFVSYKRKS